MDVKYLNKDELMYELNSRGIACSQQGCGEMRSSMRELLRLEKAGKEIAGHRMKVDAKAEIPIIQEKLQELIDWIKTGDVIDKDQVRRFSSRIEHIFNRMSNIPTDIKERSELMTKTLQLMDIARKAKKSKTPLDLSVILNVVEEDVNDVDNDSPADEESSDNELEAPAVSSTPIHTNVRSYDFSKSCEMIAKWDVKFSGARGSSVHSFLERIEELRSARNVSKAMLFAAAIDLFEGKAREWYRANRERVSSWDGLVDLLKTHYEPPDYKPRLFNDILSRTQGQHEPIVEYLSCMSAMFRRYGQLPAEAQLDIILRNLAPFYATQIPEVHSIAELETEGLKLEVRKFRSDNYHPPARDPRAYVDPQFMCLDACVSSTRANVGNNSGSSQSNSDDRACWKCGKRGHIARFCRLKDPVCFKCGKPGYKVSNCPNCRHQQGNAKQGSGRAGPLS